MDDVGVLGVKDVGGGAEVFVVGVVVVGGCGARVDAEVGGKELADFAHVEAGAATAVRRVPSKVGGASACGWAATASTSPAEPARTTVMVGTSATTAKREARAEGVFMGMVMVGRKGVVGMLGVVGILRGGGVILLRRGTGRIGVLSGGFGGSTAFAGVVGSEEGVVGARGFEVGDEVPEGSGLVEIAN